MVPRIEPGKLVLDSGRRVESRDMLTVATSAFHKFLDQAESLGVDRDGLLAAADLGEDELEGDYIAWERYILLKERALRASGDPCFPLRMADAGETRGFGLIGVVVAHQHRLGDCLKTVASFMALWKPGASFRIDEGRDEVEIEYVQPQVGNPVGLLFDAQHTLANLIFEARRMSGVEVTASRLELRDPSLDPKLRREIHLELGCEHIDLEAGRSVLGIPASILDLPVRGADPSTRPFLEEAARRQLETTPQEGEATRDLVHRVIMQGFPDALGVDDVARKLAMSRRTLARRLLEEETSFREILEEARRDAALHYVKEPSLPLGEIAWRLGYSTQASFNRAFSRWYGEPPSRVRQRSQR